MAGGLCLGYGVAGATYGLYGICFLDWDNFNVRDGVALSLAVCTLAALILPLLAVRIHRKQKRRMAALAKGKAPAVRREAEGEQITRAGRLESKHLLSRSDIKDPDL